VAFRTASQQSALCWARPYQFANLKTDPLHGADIYAAQCAGCHGSNGEGNPYLISPLWGDGSFNDGAGMYSIRKMAAFVQHNMPQNRMGILTPQEAYDVSAFIHNQPRRKRKKAKGTKLAAM
jgi:thiosulfate dehydrogenase